MLDLDGTGSAEDGGPRDAASRDARAGDAASDGAPAVDGGSTGDAATLDGGARPSLVSVIAGWQHTCALDESGGLWCWGRDDYGQVSGDPSACAASGCLVPRRVGDASITFREPLGASGEHTCAIASDGRRTCWGRNDSGMLGAGDTAGHVGLVATDADAWTLFTGGQDHMCGLREGASLWCWGDNGDGHVGDGSTVNRASPVAVAGLWVDVDAGNDFTCAIADDGRVHCWGENDFGQLGEGASINTEANPVPVPLSGSFPTGARWVDVGAGADHACGLLEDGSAWCWGVNNDGNLGSSAFMDELSPSPIEVDGGPYREIHVGGDHACAFGVDGRLWCWGDNAHGTIGNGEMGGSAAPTIVTHPEGVAWMKATVGADHTCALDAVRTLWCWGLNELGQLGVGDGTSRSSPTRVVY